MNLYLNIILCCLLAAATVAVSLYRKWLEDQCDHYIHLHDDSHDSNVISSQSQYCKRIDTMDKLRKGLLVATIVYGVAIMGIAAYTAWNHTGLS